MVADGRPTLSLLHPAEITPKRTCFDYYEKLLRLFPFSRLARNPSTFKVIPVNSTEPAVLEVPMPAPVAIEQVLAAAKDFENADSCYRLETWWDLWQFDEAIGSSRRPVPR